MRIMTLEELRNEFDRAVTDQIAVADRAQAVADAIGEAPPETLHFKGLFYHIFTTQGDAVVLALCKLFDPPPKNYPTRSIRGILAVLEEQGPALKVHRRDGIERFLKEKGGYTEEAAAALSDTKLTSAFITAYKKYLDSEAEAAVDGPASLLAKIRARRDKAVAHNEDWKPTTDEAASWDDGRRLLDVAKQFSGLVGPAYLDFHHLAQDGTYMLTKQSQMVGTQTERLIQAADTSLSLLPVVSRSRRLGKCQAHSVARAGMMHVSRSWSAAEMTRRPGRVR